MNNIVAAVAVGTAVLAGTITGCKSVPTVERMYSTSYMVGISAGMVADATKIDDDSRNAVIDVVNIVAQTVPETNQTFEAAWTPVAQAHVDKLIADGKLNKAQGELVMAAFKLAVKGIDYIFEVRYPEAKQYKDLTVAAIDGFSSGFLTTFKPANDAPAALCSRTTEYDKEAYAYLKSLK